MKNMHKIISLIGLIAIIGCGYYLYQRSKAADVVVQHNRSNHSNHNNNNSGMSADNFMNSGILNG